MTAVSLQQLVTVLVKHLSQMLTSYMENSHLSLLNYNLQPENTCICLFFFFWISGYPKEAELIHILPMCVYFFCCFCLFIAHI